MMGLTKRAGGRIGSRWSVEGMKAREGVSLAVTISWAIGDGEIKPGEKQSPAGLTGIEPLGFTKILQIFVICNDGEWVISSLQPVTPLFQHKIDGEQLTISDVIVLLCWGQFPGVVSERLEAWRLTELLGQHRGWDGWMGAVLKVVLSASKASWALMFQDRDLGFPRSMDVNGAVCRLKSLMKRR